MSFAVLSGFALRHCVAPLVVRMSGVPLHPHERDIVKGEEAHELFPKIGIQNGFAVRFLPPLLFPRINPAIVIASVRYFESDVSVTRHGSLSAESASIAAVSSILLFVVAASPPHISISRPP